MNDELVNEADSEKIEADSVFVEVTDNSTGRKYRREIPVHYLETDNGIILSGENIDGETSEIVLLSDKAVERINDLRGKGPDTPRCGH